MVGVALLEMGGVTFGKRFWIKFGKNVSILFQVISHNCYFGESTSNWLLKIVKLSKMPCVDMTSSIFFSDSGMASYCVCMYTK